MSRPPRKNDSLDPFADVGEDESGWAALIDEWDRSLRLPVATPAAEGGRALGTLLGSAGTEGGASREVLLPVAEAEGGEGTPQDIGLSLDDLERAPEEAEAEIEVEVDLETGVGLSPDRGAEVSDRPWEEDQTPFVPVEAEPVAPSPAARSGGAEPAPQVVQLGEKARPAIEEEGAFDQLLDGLVEEGLAAVGGDQVPGHSESATDGAQLAELGSLVPEEEQPTGQWLEPLPPAPPTDEPALFEEPVVPAEPPRALVEPDFFADLLDPVGSVPEAYVEAGEVLPAPRVVEAALEAGGLLQGVEDERDEGMELGAPALPDELRRVHPESLSLPERGAPERPAPEYWRELSQILVRFAEQARSSGAAASAQWMAGTAWETLGEEEEATAQYRDVCSHRPRDVAALLALARFHRRARDASGLTEDLGQLADVFQGSDRQALLAARADLLWAYGGDDLGAQTTIAGAAAGERTPRVALTEADLAAAATDLESREQALVSLVSDAADAPLEDALLCELGWTAERQGDLEGARARYEQVAARDARVPEAVEGLLRLAARDGDSRGLAAMLVRSAPLLGDWEPYRRRQAAVLGRLARLGDVDVRGELERAAAASRENPLVLESLAEVLRRDGRHREALETYRWLARTSAVPEQRAAALVEAALLAEGPLDDAASAVDLFGEAALLEPGYAPAAEGLARLQLHASDPRARVEAHRAAAQAAFGAARASEHLTAARILEGELEQADEAFGEVLTALEHDPLAPAALARLPRLGRRATRLGEVATAMERSGLASEEPALRADLLRRAASLHQSASADAEGALRCYGAVLDLDPDSRPARWGVERTLAQLGRTEELALMLRSEAAGATAPGRSASLALREGYLLWRLSSAEAGTSFARAAAADEGDPRGAWARIQWLAEGGNWREVAEHLNALADLAPAESSARRALVMRLGALAEGPLDRPSDALSAYDSAAAQPVPAPGALDGLERHCRRHGELTKLVECIERRTALETDAVRVATSLCEAAELSRRAGADWLAAEARYREALLRRPDDAFAAEALRGVYLENGADRELAEFVRGQLAAATTDGVRRRIREELIDLARRAGHATEVARLCQQLHSSHPEDLFALHLLASHALRHGDRVALLELLVKDARRTQPPLDAAALYLDLSRWIELGGGSPGADAERGAGIDVVAALEEARRHDAASELARMHLLHALRRRGAVAGEIALCRELAELTSAPAERALWHLRVAELSGGEQGALRAALKALPTHLPAIHRLRDAALATEDWAGAAVALLAESQASLVPRHRLRAYLLAGEIAAERLRDDGAAIEYYRAAVELDPAHRGGAEALVELLERAGRWTELVELLEERGRRTTSVPERIATHLRIARVAERELGRPSSARDHLRALLELDAQHREALSELARLAEADGAFAEAADALIRQARLEQDPELLRGLFLRLGSIYQEKLPDYRRAVACLKKALSMGGEDGQLEALRRLRDLYVQQQEYSAALDVTHRLLERDSDGEQRIGYLLGLGSIYEDGLRDATEAARSFRRAVEVGPCDLRAIGALCGFYARQGDQRSVMVHLDRSVATMRARLRSDPFEAFAYQALFQIFAWRKAPDGCLCAAQVLDALGHAEGEHRSFIDAHAAGVGTPGGALGEVEHDEWMFQRVIPGGFRQIFRLLNAPFAKIRRGDIRGHGVTRAERLGAGDHPVRRIAASLARDLGGVEHELYLSSAQPTTVMVENTDPPAVILGTTLVKEATDAELQFLLGRCLWIVRSAMVLPTRLRPEDLELLVAGVVRQYVPEFAPPEADARALGDVTKEVSRIVPRKLRQELMPFALECSGGGAVDLRALGGAVIHSANRAGLLACRSVHAALSALRKAAGKIDEPRDPETRIAAMRENQEIEELLRFAVSDEHFELRRAMHVGIR
ncbi:MAG: hypothetical protein IT371_06545 [Deltaproteobacteria bacterium]|nr:hypothetical protein [Deltaproteobacteria bacterium]